MWHHLPQQQQRGAQLGQRGKSPEPPAGAAKDPRKEAHADGEKGKPTARDASGQKQEGYSEKPGEETPADGEG